MASPIPLRELRNNASAILRRVEAGERFTVTVSGRPVADLGPVVPAPQGASPEALEKAFRETPVDDGFWEDVRRMREEDREAAVDPWRD